MNLLGIRHFGQSIWLDALSRKLIRAGQLRQLIDAGEITGITSNPAIFEKAIREGGEYESDIRTLMSRGKTPTEIYLHLALKDIQDAADLLRPVFDRSGGDDGYVSLEVSPLLAHDTYGTVREAKMLWTAIDRPNAMVKIPATAEGLPAISTCIADGININVTLLFGLRRYSDVADAYIAGLTQRRERNLSGRPHSVASFFLSRIDTLVDAQLDRIAEQEGETANTARELRGGAAVACAKIAYQMYKEIFSGDCKQHLLWASTGAKDKRYSDVKYVDELIGPETINTMPLETIEAYRMHGEPAARLETGVGEARALLSRLYSVGVNLSEVAQQLEDEGVAKFIAPYRKMMEHLSNRTSAVRAA